jgi:hypothetical protein
VADPTCPGPGHACPGCRPDIADVAAKCGAPFEQVLSLVEQAQAGVLDRLDRLERKEREKAAGQRVSSLSPAPGNRALRRAEALNRRARGGKRR